jgi:hypothetical protein
VASTVRTRLGVSNKPLYGFTGFVEMEGTFSFDKDAYNASVAGDSSRTVVADPEAIQLNRGYLEFRNAEWLDARAVGGRQRIIFDDARFVGNVGWRQNEQTFDAALGSTSLGVDDLTLTYSYLWDIRRIFSDRSGNGTEDWDSDSHLVNVSFERFSFARVSAFAYLLNFETDSRPNSSQSYGFRFHGGIPLGDDWSVDYAGSYAYQEDYAGNRTDYDAHYAWASAQIARKGWGSLGGGYERLGSDDGAAQFVTPLATAHKFNGFADVFLNNGGPNGLQDRFVVLAPELPCEFKGKLFYHNFRSVDGSDKLGDEFDFVFSRPLGWSIEWLVKGGFFWAHGGSGLRDIFRVTTSFSYRF